MNTSAEAPAATAQRSVVPALIAAMRPYQWPKNVIVFAALTLTYVIKRESLKEQREKLKGTRELPPPNPNLQLPERDTNDLIPVPSVVEDTTKLLNIDARPKSPKS